MRTKRFGAGIWCLFMCVSPLILPHTRRTFTWLLAVSGKQTCVAERLSASGGLIPGTRATGSTYPLLGEALGVAPRIGAGMGMRPHSRLGRSDHFSIGWIYYNVITLPLSGFTILLIGSRRCFTGWCWPESQVLQYLSGKSIELSSGEEGRWLTR